MRFLVDECTDKRLAVLLKEAGYDVLFAGDWKPGTAEEEDRILITDDKDFEELVFRLGKPSSGVILIRNGS